jgi:hypothetical protein
MHGLGIQFRLAFFKYHCSECRSVYDFGANCIGTLFAVAFDMFDTDGSGALDVVRVSRVCCTRCHRCCGCNPQARRCCNCCFTITGIVAIGYVGVHWQDEFEAMTALINDPEPRYPGNFKNALEGFDKYYYSDCWMPFNFSMRAAC